MKARCIKCKKYLGEIRDGTLHKNIMFICLGCNQQREALDLRYKNENKGSNDFMDTFRDIFGGSLDDN